MNRIFKKINKKYYQNFQAIGYEKYQSQIYRVINKKSYNNILIIGEQGVGKTHLVHSIIPHIENNVLSLDVDSLIEEIFNVNQDQNSQEKIKYYLNQLKDEAVIIDEINTIFNNEPFFSFKVHSFLKNLLSRNGVAIIATITPQHYREYVEKNNFVNKYFENIKVFEPSYKTSIKILQHITPDISNSYQVSIDEKILDTVISLSNRYIPSFKQPMKSIKLLEESAVHTKQSGSSIISIEDIKYVLSDRTGIPIQEINESDLDKLQNLETLLSNYVKGQNQILHKISNVIRRSRAGVKDPHRPIGSFLFIGPSGVGKTHLAKSLAKTIYNDETSLIRLDMSEFSESHNVQRLVGAPPGYVGYEEGGQLTNPVLEKPYSLLLLDEIEKAHPRVFDIFLQVLDEGRLTDGQGKTIDFNNTIIIATSNIGLDLILQTHDSNPHILDEDDFISQSMMPIFMRYFRPEFINRFDDISLFKPLNIEDIKKIALNEIKILNFRLKDRSMQIEVSDGYLDYLINQSYEPRFGARPLRRLIQENIENEVARQIINGSLKPGMVLHFD